MGFNAKIKTVCSKEFKVCGAVGGCCTLGTKHASVSETEIGESGTTEWCAGVLDRGTTLAFFFEPSNQGNNSESKCLTLIELSIANSLYTDTSKYSKLYNTTQ